MKVLIVFESMFGNTAALAGDVMGGLAEAGADVALADVEAAPEQGLLECDLLVLAAPTHALSLSRPASRAEAVSKGADPARAASGLREWLSTLDANLSSRTAIVVFDTRVHKARHLPGSAAKSTVRTLKKSGFAVVDRASFYVDDIAGPIHVREHERAREWGRSLAPLVQPGAPSHGAG